MSEGVIPERVRQALADYGENPASADPLFQVACVHVADPLPLYRGLYMEVFRRYAVFRGLDPEATVP